jgi:hypothetical protein
MQNTLKDYSYLILFLITITTTIHIVDIIVVVNLKPIHVKHNIFGKSSSYFDILGFVEIGIQKRAS